MKNLSYHLANLALVGGVQPEWEADNSENTDLDNLFAIPRKYYGDLFEARNTSFDDIYDDIQSYVRNHYEMIGAIRLGQESCLYLVGHSLGRPFPKLQRLTSPSDH